MIISHSTVSKKRKAGITLCVASALCATLLIGGASYASAANAPASNIKGQPHSNPAYSLVIDSVNDSGWKYPDDIPASVFTDKDGSFHFSQSHALYGKNDSRAWKFYTGKDLDSAVPDKETNESGTNPDTTHFCNISPTGRNSSSAPAGSSFSQPNYCDLTQLWVDPDTGDWYGLVHNEFTPQPFGDGSHFDAIDYAVSHDKGKHWDIPGHAITSPYSTTRGDKKAFPESTYYYGDGDPRLYTDYSSGYFYVFYGSRIIDKSSGWKAFYEHVARAPIAKKMATGSWQKWYNGKWEQPGVGGKESNIVPVSKDNPRGYTDPAKEYKPTTPGKSQEQIDKGLMPPTSPLFVMDVAYDAYLGLFISEPQNPDQSGKAPQEFYATKDLATQQWFKLGDSGKYTGASWYRWFLDAKNKTSSAILGKSFRAYCSIACFNGSSGDYTNISLKTNQPNQPIDPTKTYTIANAQGSYLVTSADGASVSGAKTATRGTGAWKFQATGDGSYTIANQAGRLLGVDSATANSRAWDSALTLTAPLQPTIGQEWFVMPSTGSTTSAAAPPVRLVNRYSGLVIGLDSNSATTVPSRTWDRASTSRAASSSPARQSVAGQSLTVAEFKDPAPTPAPVQAQARAPKPAPKPQSIPVSQPKLSAVSSGKSAATLASTGADIVIPAIIASALLVGGVFALVTASKRGRAK